ncbi:hypothetical protein Psed_6973 (plasmid) [Pseudonocardia dioxanivorans CB1190]|uniref:Uncharacterized protein n=1 Tax=Pseudonocardia dioxanivorans (strain ATCC 55486 / DSM 44775 / JCM 13855 / CB1190) TaxID=675635 RepID=F2L762_PSEUX|nr:hypothetical protein Psed_6973 [Pseudonocardia dioxanivorans CB1190]
MRLVEASLPYALLAVPQYSGLRQPTVRTEPPQ